MLKKSIIIIVSIVILAGLAYGGYLYYIKMSIDGLQPIPANTTADKTTYTLADIAKHSNQSDCWFAINGKVLDVTTFIPMHPGGNVIVDGCGKDASDYFNGVNAHMEPVVESLKSKFTIGSLVK